MSSAASQGLTHFSFRHDASVETVRDCLARFRNISIMDCGCGTGELPKALMLAGLDVGRIRYYGTDHSTEEILTARAEYEQGCLGNYQTFDLSVREIHDIAGYQPTAFDLIILNNILHEISAEQIAQILLRLNGLLVRPKGLICIADMQELPEDEAFEPWAVPFSCEEIVHILRAGGWSPHGSEHLKRVPAYRVLVGPAQEISPEALNQALRAVLNSKRTETIKMLDKRRCRRDTSVEMQHLACRLTAITLSLRRLRAMR